MRAGKAVVCALDEQGEIPETFTKECIEIRYIPQSEFLIFLLQLFRIYLKSNEKKLLSPAHA